MRVLAALAVAASLGCAGSTGEPEPAVGPGPEVPAALGVAPHDAGDEAWVKRVLPFVWGRRPVSVREVEVFVQLTEARGREQVVRAMAGSEEYRRRWGLFLRDALAVHRLGFSANPGCYGATLRPEPTGDLAAFVRDNAAIDSSWDVPWTVLDLIESALVLDDLSPIYRAHLVAQLDRALDDMHQLAAISQRRNRAQSFMASYLHRQMSCLPCHNSEFSVTGHEDPALDRTWEVPGLYEKAIFGLSAGRDIVDLSPFFRRKGVLAGYYYTHDAVPQEQIDAEYAAGVQPWGWSDRCGRFHPPDNVHPDDVEDARGFFVEDRADNGSVWDVLSVLSQGFASLRGGPLRSGPDVAPGEALATLVSLNVADQVWEAAFGRRLTIINYFPRNRAQRDTLAWLTETFVAGGYSLEDLVVAVALHPYFNGAAPTGGQDPRPYAAVFDPFADESLPPGERRNGLGDTLQRAPARLLLSGVHGAMGWPTPPEFLMYYLSPQARLQRSVGVFLKNGDPGFSGTSFQSALAWETLYGVCVDRSVDPVCPLAPILEDEKAQKATVCELCASRDEACAWDARCCDLAWDSICPTTCDTGDPDTLDLAVFPRWDPPAGGDWIATLMAAPPQTLEDAVRALKDRLLTDPRLDDPAEREVLEAMLGAALETPMAQDAETEARLRRVCGLLLASPQVLLLGAPGESTIGADPGAFVAPGTSRRELCEGLAPLFGSGVVCEASGARVSP